MDGDVKNSVLNAPIQQVEGEDYLHDAKGALVMKSVIKAEHLLEDEMVRKMMVFAMDISAQIDRFKDHVITDLADFDEMLEQEYGATRGGQKGNRQYRSYNNCFEVRVQVADFVDFGPQLQIAKKLIDECLNEWTEDSSDEVRTIITKAFNTDKAGRVNRAEIFMLLRLDFQDERWQRAMEAIKNAIRIVGSKEYFRFYQRKNPSGEWQAVTIDIAKAKQPTGAEK